MGTAGSDENRAGEKTGSLRLRNLKHVEDLCQIALGYEDIASLTVGDITIVKRPPPMEMPTFPNEPAEYAEPSADDLVEHLVESTEGPDDEG